MARECARVVRSFPSLREKFAPRRSPEGRRIDRVPRGRQGRARYLGTLHGWNDSPKAVPSDCHSATDPATNFATSNQKIEDGFYSHRMPKPV